MELPGRYSLTGARNLTALSASEAASQDSRLGESGFGGDLSAASTLTVSGTTKALLE